ncbi:MAG: hypothetical protein AAFR38_04020 [Planctomycetota bacterium]
MTNNASNNTDPSRQGVPLGPLAGALAIGSMLGALLAALVALPFGVDRAGWALASVATVLPAAALGIAVLKIASTGGPATLPMAVMFSQVVRFGVALAIAVAIYLGAGADKLAFWGGFLGASLLGLAAEVSVVVRAMQPQTTNPQPPATEATA